MTNKVMVDEDGNKVLDPLGRFTEEVISLLLGLADQAAVNLNKTRIYSQSITDRMTGLHNGRHFEQVFFDQTCDSIKDNKPMALAIVDIDRFKLFNDQHGHSAGDEVLKHVAKIFESCVRPGTGDIAFRYGGEEFCMLLPQTSAVDAMNVLENFRAKVEATKLRHGDKDLEVTVSVGLASSILDGADTKVLFERADEALYACKNGGRNQVRHFAAGRMVRFQATELVVEIDNAYAQASVPSDSDVTT
jgi:diguanylate cyclase (GGDEF)-like protein